jgi:hypothetical protein
MNRMMNRDIGMNMDVNGDRKILRSLNMGVNVSAGRERETGGTEPSQ